MKHVKLFEEFISEAEKVKGGMSDNMTLSDIAKHHGVELAELEAEYTKGLKVEMEHTSDNEIAAEIARDHLYEDPKYYTKLATIESVVTEANVKKEAQMVADQVIGGIQDQYYDEGYYNEDEVYYSLKNYFNSFGIKYDNNPVFDAAYKIVMKWVKKNIK